MAKKKKKKEDSEIEKFSRVPADLYRNLTSVRFKVKGKIYEVSIGEELLFDEDLHTQVERLPSIMGYFGSIVAYLQEEYDNSKTVLERIKAKIDKKVRESGAIGEQRIAQAVKRHPKWLEAALNVNRAKKNLYKARNLYKSLIEKGISNSTRSSDLRSVPSDSIQNNKSEYYDDDEED